MFCTLDTPDPSPLQAAYAVLFVVVIIIILLVGEKLCRVMYLMFASIEEMNYR